MKARKILSIVALLLVMLGGFTLLNFTYDRSAVATGTDYEMRSLHSRDGIGKFYQGREIAKVMGHQEMLWLERPSREVSEQPQDVITSLGLKKTDIVADIGAGTGYFSLRMAPLVVQLILPALEARRFWHQTGHIRMGAIKTPLVSPLRSRPSIPFTFLSTFAPAFESALT